MFESTAETLVIAWAGTALAVLISLPLGFMAATNVTPWFISQPLKWLFGFIRSIPLIVLALIFAAAVGLGAFPSLLAVTFHSVGMLGKFYVEEFETADERIVKAIEGTGATWLQTLRFGLFPQSIPQVIAFSVFRFEINFRDAAVLGLVGAGGIGYYLQVYFRADQCEKAGILLLAVFAVVTLLDQLTYWVRR